jgi:hypothetical protein
MSKLCGAGLLVSFVDGVVEAMCERGCPPIWSSSCLPCFYDSVAVDVATSIGDIVRERLVGCDLQECDDWIPPDFAGYSRPAWFA